MLDVQAAVEAVLQRHRSVVGDREPRQRGDHKRTRVEFRLGATEVAPVKQVHRRIQRVEVMVLRTRLVRPHDYGTGEIGVAAVKAKERCLHAGAAPRGKVDAGIAVDLALERE